MTTMQSLPLFVDPARKILSAAPLTDPVRETLWDLFWASGSARELQNALVRVPVDGAVKQDLIRERAALDSNPDPLDKAVEAMKHLRRFDPRLLALAEKHAGVTKFLIDAAMREVEHGD